MSEWVKPGASMDEFSYTKYQCLQESQQRQAHFAMGGGQGQYGLQYGAESVDHVVTNDGLFRACMNAHGWYLQRVGDYRQGYN